MRHLKLLTLQSSSPSLSLPILTPINMPTIKRSSIWCKSCMQVTFRKVSLNCTTMCSIRSLSVSTQSSSITLAQCRESKCIAMNRSVKAQIMAISYCQQLAFSELRLSKDKQINTKFGRQEHSLTVPVSLVVSHLQYSQSCSSP